MSGKRLYELTIVSMIQQLEIYLNPFDEQPARKSKTGEVVEENIIKGLLSSSILGENLLLEFINKRLLPSVERVDLFLPINNPKLETGLKKKKQTPKIINVLKEDKQIFGLLVGSAASLSIDISSFSIGISRWQFKARIKAALRNYLISESNALLPVPVQKEKWIVDGMPVIPSMQSRRTWGEFCQAFVQAYICQIRSSCQLLWT